MMIQDLCNIPPGFNIRSSKSAPCSPVKPLGVIRTRSDSFHVTHKVPVGDTPYVKAKNVQLVDKDPERAIPLFWAAINAGDRVDSALKDMAIVMKQQNRAEEAIEAIKSLRSKCSDQAQESLDNILLDLYKRCGRLGDQISLLKHKLCLIQQGMAFNGKRTKTARSQGKKFQLSVEQEATRLLGNLGWAFMQQNNYIEAEDAYRRALLIAPDNNKMCNLGICLMKQGRVVEAKETLRRVRPAMADGPRGIDSHLKAFERAQQMLRDLESELMNKVGEDRVEQSRLFDAFLGSSSIWQPQPCREPTFSTSSVNTAKPQEEFADENINMNNNRTNHHHQVMFPFQMSSSSSSSTKPSTLSSLGNSLNIDAPPFYSSKLMKNPSSGTQFHDNVGAGLKRTRSINAGGGGFTIMKEEEIGRATSKILLEQQQQQPDNKSRRIYSSTPVKEDNELTRFLPDNNAFEEAIIAAVIGGRGSSSNETMTTTVDNWRKIDKRLRVFEDITFSSLSPRAA